MRQLNYTIAVPNTVMNLVGTGLQPQVVGYTNTNAGYQSVVVSGTHAYVIGTGGSSGTVIGLTVTIFDVSNPTTPVYTGYITTGSVPWVSGPSYLNGAYMAVVSGNYLYIASSGSSYLYVINVANPSAPFNAAALLISGTPGSLYGISKGGNYIYLATQNKGLTVVDVTNPLAPAQVFQEGGTLNKSIGVFVSGGYVYTTNYQTTAPWTVRFLKIWTISNPASPVLIETYTLPAGTKPAEVQTYGNYAYVSDLNTNSIQIIDITNPLAPVYLSSMVASANFDVTNTVSVLAADGDYVYITSGGNATYGGAIDFFDITNKSSPILVSTTKEGVPSSLFTGSVLYNNLLYVADYGVSPSYHASLKIYSTQRANTNLVYSSNMTQLTAQITASLSTAAGSFTVQGSNDIAGSDGSPGTPANWSDISSQIAVSGSGTYITPVLDVCYQAIRLSYVNTGTGGISAVLKLVGDE